MPETLIVPVLMLIVVLTAIYIGTLCHKSGRYSMWRDLARYEVAPPKDQSDDFVNGWLDAMKYIADHFGKVGP